jgi:hypothetical protein
MLNNRAASARASASGRSASAERRGATVTPSISLSELMNASVIRPVNSPSFPFVPSLRNGRMKMLADAEPPTH